MISAATGNETVPAIDEHPPTIGPNLAGNQELCKAITRFLTWTYWWPYELMQQRFWDAARRIDNAWRVRYAASDLNITAVTQQTVKDATPLPQDGQAAKGQSTEPFRQINAITNLWEILTFDGEGPVRFQVPDDVEEDFYYRPTEQSAIALNAILRKNSKEVNIRDNGRRAFGCFAKYGYGWVHAPLDLRQTEVPRVVAPPGPVDPVALQKQFPNQELQMTPQGVVVLEKRLKVTTQFHPLHFEDVYCDPFVSLDPIDRQPCPFVRTPVTAYDLLGYAYDPEKTPFGFLNIEMAIDVQKGHYMLTDVDMQPLRDRLKNRYNLNDQVDSGTKRVRAHQMWTAYPMLGISDTGELDEGDGVACPTCQRAGKVQWEALDSAGQVQTMMGDCPQCQGKRTIRVPAKRYVVNFFGGLMVQTTCIRIQEMPEGMEIPIIVSRDLVEDDSASIPTSKSEAMLVACEQVTRAESQFERSKEGTINRPWKCLEDSPAFKVQDKNKPGTTIPCESALTECEKAEQSSYDDSQTLLPYIQRCDGKIQAIFGATDTLLGQISQGRRSALEIGEATDAAKNPLVIMVDRHNTQVFGRWAYFIQRNMEMFGDRDYIRRLTGRTYFGECEIFTAVGQEFIKKMAVAASLRETLQISAADPVVMPVRPQLWNELFKITGIRTRIPDNGLQIAQRDGLNIVNKILAEGIPDPALPTDPHEAYVGIFDAVLKDPYWQQKYPQNIPLLFARMKEQEKLLEAQQEKQREEMARQQQMMNPGGGPPNAKKSKSAPNGAGEANQHAQG